MINKSAQKKLSFNQNSGQALLVILLIMAVILTIGLSIVSRSVTDVNISTQEQESARAFSVAEAGLESLLAGGTGEVSFEGFDVATETEELGNSTSFVFPRKISSGDAQSVWLVSHIDEDTLDTDFSSTRSYFDLYWGDEGASADEDTTPALEAILYYNNGSSYTTYRQVYDPNAARRLDNSFIAANTGSYNVSGTVFPFSARLSSLPSGNLYLLRLKLLYNSTATYLGVASDEILPLQGNCFVSTATSQSSGISRRVQQCKLYKSLPSIFDYVLYSSGGLVK